MNNNCNCLIDVLKLIDCLQKNVESSCVNDSGCSKPFLGPDLPISCFNTRPVTFYNCNNDLITINYTFEGESACSSVFRIKDIHDCCVTLTILRNTTPGSTPTFVSTNQTVILNIDCVCAIKCLADISIDL